MSQDPQIELNTQIRLMRVPTDKYPNEDPGIFQIKVSPPTPTDKVPENSVIVRNLYISIDATMRVWISGVTSYLPPVKPGDVMRALCVGEVLFSKSKKFKVGDLAMGMIGWQKYAVLKDSEVTQIPKEYPNPEHFLGVYGISGLTAYVGVHDIGKIKKDDIVVISAAAGAVGEIAVQLAKYHGCTVCGIAGSEEKCKYLKEIGADQTINYKKQSVKKQLKKKYPEGIDVYFDNVGGQMLDDVLMNVRQHCRIILCGLISTYGSANPYKLKNYSRLIIKRGTMQGYLYFDYAKNFKPMITELMKIMGQGKLRTRVDMCYGLDECPNALIKLLNGKNDGKVIVKANSQKQTAKL